MKLIALPVAGSGGRDVLINPQQVVCVLDVGERRSQIITTGLSSESSISIIVELGVREVEARLNAAAQAA